MKELKVTRKDLKNGIKLTGGEEYTLVLVHAKAHRLEIEDAFFQTASAVFLPDVPLASEGAADDVAFSNDDLWKALSNSHKEFADNLKNVAYDPTADGSPHVTGAELLLRLLRFLQKNKNYRLLIAGHTDRAGDAAYNQKLSDARATSTLAILQGDRATFVSTCKKFHVADDDAVYIRYAARTRGWPCDLDGDKQASPQEIRAFQKSYNEEFGAKIAVDGSVGPQTLGAYYDILADDLESAVGGKGELRDLRGNLRFVDDQHRCLGFGEQYPIDPSEPDGTRCQSDRRVELLLFEPPLMPDLTDTQKAGQDIYRDKLYHFTPLVLDESEPTADDDDVTVDFTMVDAEPPEPGVGEPEEELATTMDFVESAHDPQDAWAFLEPLDAARTAVGDWPGSSNPDGTALA